MKDCERSYRALYEMAATVNSGGALDSVLSSLVESAAKALEVKGCSLMLLSPDHATLEYAAAHGLSARYGETGPVSADRSISEALEGKAVTILDATQDERIQYREQARQEGIASVLSVPMKLKGKMIGVVRIYTGEQRQFTEDDIYFVEALANLSAIALENAKLCESCQLDSEALRQELLEWRKAMGVWPPRLAYRR